MQYNYIDYTYGDWLDFLAEAEREAQKYDTFTYDAFEALMDSVVEGDSYRDFADALDAAHDDAMSMPDGKARMFLTFVIDALMQKEF
jgi:hypothetical protein